MSTDIPTTRIPMTGRRKGRLWAALIAAVVLVGAAPAAASQSLPPDSSSTTVQDSARPVWTAAWSATPTPAIPGHISSRGLTNQTFRNIVHLHSGAQRLRVRLTNEHGTGPVTFDKVTIGISAGGATIDPDSVLEVFFRTHSGTTIAQGAADVSDPVDLQVPPGSNVAVSVYADSSTGPITGHLNAREYSYLSAGDRASDAGGSAFTYRTSSWWFLSGIDMYTQPSPGAVAVVGDSTTDGSGSPVGANERWTDYLARRFQTLDPAHRMTVLNAGNSGNRLLSNHPTTPSYGINVLARLDRDALDKPGIRSLVLVIGPNDVNTGPDLTAAGFIDGLRQVAQRAHDSGIIAVVATIQPLAGGLPNYTPEKERLRQEVNTWIRGQDEFDGILDVDAVLQDPADPTRLLPAYDSGDGLHPSSAGYQAVAEAVELSRLTG